MSKFEEVMPLPQAETEKPLPKQNLETPLRYKLLNELNGLLRPLDKTIGQDRAEDLLKKSGFSEYFKEGGKYLDIGTGPGHILEKMLAKTKDMNTKFFGLDAWAKPFNAVRDRLDQGEGNEHFLKAAGQQLPIKPKSLDGALMFFAMQQIPEADQKMVINEIRQMLKDDGNIFLMDDTPKNKTEIEEVSKWQKLTNYKWFKGKKEEQITSLKSPEQWEQFFEDNDLEVINETHPSSGKIPHSAYVLKFKQEEPE